MIHQIAKSALLAWLFAVLIFRPDAHGLRLFRTPPEVSSVHPRIYVRGDGASVGRGLTVSQFRERLKDPSYKRWIRTLTGQDLGSTVERAARYLETGSGSELEAVRSFLLSHTYSQKQHDVGGLLAGAEMAMAFDWVYQGIREPDRAAILSNIVTTADSSYDFLIHGEPDVNHNYTYMALRTIAVCGLVLKGEAGPFDHRADEYLALAQEWLEAPGKVLDTWKAREGAWAEGSHYTFHETIRTLIMTLHAYRTASQTDYLDLIVRKYGNFIAGSGRFLIACTRPDLTFERIGDVSPSRAFAAITVPLTVEMLAAGLEDSGEQARLRSFGRALLEAYGNRALHPSFDWGMRMFFDPRAPVEPSYKTLPLALRLGKGSDEHIVFRNGWGPGSTLISILSGNHYTDHQHFDKGHFLIYHNGGLLVDSGAYDGMSAVNSHWSNYSTRTLAHNCLLIFDPSSILRDGYANDGGQTVLRGLQHHADWTSYLEHSHREQLDAARVEAYESDARLSYDYVRCNLAGAYRDRIRNYSREFVYLPDADLVALFDRVRLARPGLTLSWLLHFQDRPRVDGVAPEAGVARFPNARHVSVARNGRLDLGARTVAYNGELLIRPLLPERRTVSIVGGAGFEYYSSFSRKNYPPAVAANAAPPREAGEWRMEVAPAGGDGEALFLNAFQIADASTHDAVEARLVADRDRKAAGILFLTPPANRVVLFSRNPDASKAALPVRYRVDSNMEARHLLVGLPPGQEVTIRVGRGPLFPGRISPQGVLSFEDRRKGRRTVEIQLPRAR